MTNRETINKSVHLKKIVKLTIPMISLLKHNAFLTHMSIVVTNVEIAGSAECFPKCLLSIKGRSKTTCKLRHDKVRRDNSSKM